MSCVAITLDLETKNIQGVLEPVCINLYDGKKSKSFYIEDYNSVLEMVKDVFNYLKYRKYNYQRIYVHNLSYFDGVFLLKLLSNIKVYYSDSQSRSLPIQFPSIPSQFHPSSFATAGTGTVAKLPSRDWDCCVASQPGLELLRSFPAGTGTGLYSPLNVGWL